MKYSDAGVDVERGYEEVSLIKKMCEKTYSRDVLSGVGGFGAMFNLDTERYKNPVLVSGSDGVGTKLLIAQKAGIHNSCGIDLVAMCVNDVICQGAKPLFFLDYIATGRLEPSKMANIVEGIAKGCEISDCSLIGGETAEMPDMYGEEDYDLAGFVVGVVDREDIINGSTIKGGDIVIGLESSGVHSNGFSLVRKIVFEKAGLDIEDELYDGVSVKEGLLAPTRIYVRDVLDLLEKVKVKAIANITGGGLYENIPRALNGHGAEIDLTNYKMPRLFERLQELGGVETEEMLRAFNCGIGMVLVVDSEDEEKVIEHFKDYKAFKIGEIRGTKLEIKF
ncbi:phosphoribosylformylglycinamidine cyclo-ligase [Peptoniphilus asaccharolyticus DSM 20463]|uniref:Phosphoribosylformylglycinamidine cyclo-ligase n=1 Tax=Peptoniphilus asaccharolyticus DSM 20463 TaxID=573058 RepID=A0A1W1V336_PEPAS|nr:phosphoribosylformylglycinamidine cyclo-ligase [Peptoniphilus asaccharolyticus]MBL7576181.1 phosphoribosylformylglycinamidine cyclo-ligase [Peptoniphilus asaccharolyticus]SMB87742.1 phosphoribosylformylglycinamidine cyclo-ligase [Peptoniphilus asaccharolyticus DSM 20463]